MNKRQREVELYKLDQESAVLKQLERQYRLALDDVQMTIRLLQADEQTQSKIHRINYQKKLEKQLEGALEKLHMSEYKSISKYLNDSYTTGYVGVMYDLHGQEVPLIAPIDQNAAVKAIQLDTKLSDRKIHPSMNGEMVTLYESLGVDVDNLKDTIRKEITRGIASGMKYDDIARNISYLTKAPWGRAKTIVRTEGHRIQQQSAEDARQEAKANGADVVKQWDATMDGATRHNHRILDGKIVEVNERFKIGKFEPRFPGDFGDPAEDCNCRCVALTRSRKSLDAEELETLKERAAYFKLDKSKDFADFEKKYLHATKNPSNTTKPLKSQAKSGKMNTRGITQRNMSNGLRTSPLHILSEEEMSSVLNDADSLGIPRTVLRFNQGAQTGFYDNAGLIYIRGDILPDNDSINLRDRLSQRAVLAHEYYGHYLSNPSPFRIGDWRDEFMASYKAAVNAPGLSDKERRMLMLDAYDRAKEAGVPVKYNKKARELIYGDE